MSKFLLSIVVLFSTVFMPLMATAQMAGVSSGSSSGDVAAELPDPLTPEAVRELVSRLSDDDVRALLLQQLDAAAQGNSDTPVQAESLLNTLNDIAVAFYTPIVTAFERIPLLVTKQADHKFFMTYHDCL